MTHEQLAARIIATMQASRLPPVEAALAGLSATHAAIHQAEGPARAAGAITHFLTGLLADDPSLARRIAPELKALNDIIIKNMKAGEEKRTLN